MAGLSTYGKSGNLNSGKGTIAAAKSSIKADISAARKLASQSRRKGFKYTTDVNAAIYGNLATTVSGYGRSLTAEQSRQMQALRALKANTAAREAGLAQGAADVVRSQYGSVIAGAVRPATRGLQVMAKAATKEVNAQVGAAGIVARGNEAAQATLGQGVAMANASAQYATAQALEYRAKSDAQLIASQKLELDKMILANKLDLANYKAKLAMQEKAAGAGTVGQMTAVATTVSSAVPALLTSFRDVANREILKDPSDPNSEVIGYEAPAPAAVAQDYMNKNGIAFDSPEGQVIMSVASAMGAAGAGTPGSDFSADRVGIVTEAVNQRMAMLYPQFAKSQSTIDGLIASTATGWALQNSYAPNAPADAGGLGMFGSDKPGSVSNIAGGVVAGAGVGATVGLLGGPFAPISVPVGAAVGAVIGGLAGAVDFNSPNVATEFAADIVRLHKQGKSDAEIAAYLKKYGG